MNLPPVPDFNSAPYQIKVAQQQVSNRAQVLNQNREAQAAAQLQGYIGQLQAASGRPATTQLLQNMQNAGLATQGTDLSYAAMKYAGMA